TGTNLLTLKGHTSFLFSAAFSSDGRRIVTAGGHDQTAKVWDAATGTYLLTLAGHRGWVMSAGFSPDGQRIVTGSEDGTGKVWDASSGKELLTFKEHGGWVFSVAFSPDGRWIVTGSGDRASKVWETASAEQVVSWRKEEQAAAEYRAAQERERAAAAKRDRDFRDQDPGIEHWLVLAPIAFAGTDGEVALDQEQIPQEARLRPRAGERVNVGGDERIWSAMQPKGHWIDFNQLAGKETAFSVAYAVCFIVSETDQRGLVMKVGSDDQAKIFLNEREIYRQTAPTSWEPDRDQVPRVEIKAGINVLVFKVVNEKAGWGGSVRFTDTTGQPVKGIRVVLTPP
ncbi:MAG: WD40 repeat domain-containing protein, partial [Verrucomicrobiota bacterium]